MARYDVTLLTNLKRRALAHVFDKHYAWRLNEFSDGQVITIDYPVDPRPRYPIGGEPHPELWAWFDGRRGACSEALRMLARHRIEFERIPDETAEPEWPHWNQVWFTALDAMTLYALVANRQPRRIVEVGSGNSTKFARRAMRDHDVQATLVSIDPHPRAEIDALCTRVIRQPLEQVEHEVFAGLEAGDVLFIDSSHRVFTNSDVAAFFLEILPRLRPGVLLHIHDIFLPWDYPVTWSKRYYSEQYLLATWLLAGPERLRLVMSNGFVCGDPALRQEAIDLFEGSPLQAMMRPEFSYGRLKGMSGTSFWAEVA